MMFGCRTSSRSLFARRAAGAVPTSDRIGNRSRHMADERWFSRFWRRSSDESDQGKPALTPANDNPWYCVATIHGEQPSEGFDDDVARKNQQVWSRWVGQALKAEGNERAEFERNFANRTGGSLEIPDPDAIVDFSNTHFILPVNFFSFHFPRGVDFSSATFSGEAKFESANFSAKADFTSATFSGMATFTGTQFNAGLDFQSATFSNKVDFQNTILVDPDFRSVTFSDTANFRRARFIGALRADYSLATFSRAADFGSAAFNVEADFDSARFLGMINFRSVTFSNIADFTEATFSSSVHFVDAKFATYTIFAEARFEGEVPDFRGATMHEATEWHGVTWPEPPRSKENAQQQVYGYERLKQEMERLKKHDDEQRFFRRELRARRRLLWTSPWEWLLNFFYQASSDYGNSFKRPLFWLSVVFAAGAAIFASAPLYCGAPMPITLAARLSFANIFLFLPNKREIMLDANTARCLSTATLQAVSAAQSLLGVVLLFLLGLALRNRFRMR
jgi:hypothetical protein